MKIPTVLLFLVMLTAIRASRAQVNDHAIRQSVLERGIANKDFIFGKWTENGGTETHLTYLGKVETNSQKVFKVMNSVWVWGLSQRATNRILIFDERNRYVGEYGITTTDDMPTRLVDGVLIFENKKDSDCDASLVTRVDLTRGLPIRFFRKCRGEFGDLYYFN